MTDTKEIHNLVRQISRQMFIKGLFVGLIPLIILVLFAGSLPHLKDVADALFIDKDGNVGIGTNQPGAKLDVNGNVKTKELTSTGTIKANKFKGDGSALKVDSNENLKKALDMKVDTTGGNITGSLMITEKVGIGRKSPEAQLDVDGKAKIRGGIEPGYDSGWFKVNKGKDYSKTHNLGIIPRQIQVFYSEDNTGSPAYIVSMFNSGYNYGYQVKLTETDAVIMTGKTYVCLIARGKAKNEGFYRVFLWK